jgi:acetyl esterase/lipase
MRNSLLFALFSLALGFSLPAQENITYGTANGTDLHLDIYQPANAGSATYPAVLLIHGGGWISFDKSTMRGMGGFLARNGFIAFAVDYRLFQNGQNRWPAQLEDVRTAVRWVRANAAKYHVDPDHIGAFGHSAGAQLAALLGMENTPDTKVQAVVDVSGPIDFTGNNDPDSVAFFTSFMGSPDARRNASPLFHVSKASAPFLIMHGTKDESVPLAESQELFDKLQAAGVPAQFVKVDDVHTFQTPEARHQLTTETLAFFNRYLAGPPTNR